MTNQMVGCIGVGEMGETVARALLTLGKLNPNRLFLGKRNAQRIATLSREFPGVRQGEESKTIAQEAEILIVGVKPQQQPELACQIRDNLRPETLIVSLAAGLSLEDLKSLWGEQALLVRLIPNLSIAVGEGTFLATCDPRTPAARLKSLWELLERISPVEVIEEKQIDGATALCSSGLAVVALFVEALADGAVATGLPRRVAYRLATQTVKGASKWLECDLGVPSDLKDRVASPGGVTIEMVRALEQRAFRSAVIEAVLCGQKKSSEGLASPFLSKEKVGG